MAEKLSNEERTVNALEEMTDVLRAIRSELMDIKLLLKGQAAMRGMGSSFRP